MNAERFPDDPALRSLASEAGRGAAFGSVAALLGRFAEGAGRRALPFAQAVPPHRRIAP